MKKSLHIVSTLAFLLVVSLSVSFAQDKPAKKQKPTELKTLKKAPATPNTPAAPASLQLPANTTPTSQLPTTVNRPEYLRILDKLPATQVEWSKEVYDFGEVAMGEKILYKFTFKNTGEQPLRVTHVKPSCGCTTPDWTREAIAPGEEGFVEVQFDTNGKKGAQNKSVTLFLNTETQRKVLRFKGIVTEPKAVSPSDSDE